MKVGLAGGTPTVLASGLGSRLDGGSTGLGALAVDATSVYWVNVSFVLGSNDSLMKVDRNGGTPVILASGIIWAIARRRGCSERLLDGGAESHEKFRRTASAHGVRRRCRRRRV